MVETNYLADLKPGINVLECAQQVELRLTEAGLFFGHGVDNPFDEAVWAVLHGAGMDIGEFNEEQWQTRLDAAQLKAIKMLFDQRVSTRKPLAYLINQAWFAGLPFYIDERAIVPRSHLGEWIQEAFTPWIEPEAVNTALDLCCGGGCIAIALAHYFPTARIDAADLSAEALEVARINIERYDLNERIDLFHSDLFSALPGAYDLIVCNPPYVDDATVDTLPEEYQFEPVKAFAGGADGMDIVAQILAQADEHLTPNGHLIVEVGAGAPALESRYPGVAFNWLLSAGGEPVIFQMSRRELVKMKHENRVKKSK